MLYGTKTVLSKWSLLRATTFPFVANALDGSASFFVKLANVIEEVKSYKKIESLLHLLKCLQLPFLE